jgi:signal transduction histidine kinase
MRRQWRMSWLGWYVRARLHRRLFIWFGFSIVLTAAAVSVAMRLANRSGVGLQGEQQRARTFIAHQFASVWSDPARRAELATSIATDLDMDVAVIDQQTGARADFGSTPCQKPWAVVPVQTGGALLGEVHVCASRHGVSGHWIVFWPLGLLLLLLWAGSGRIARRIARPLSDLARVASDLGAGKLSSRARVNWRESEVAVLAEVFNEMAARIERQIADQRELLAGVSHELRTPLARIRLLIELLRDGAGPARLDEIEREVVEIDNLVGELLASSRLDFSAIVPRPLDGAEVAHRALDRAGLTPELLETSGDLSFGGDPTLIARALANLLDNARKHGGGLVKLRAEQQGNLLAFEADDNGPGIPAEDPESVFRPFAPRQDGKPREQGSLGLGLTLVRRIAEAHGGRAYASNRPGGGARIGFTVLRERPDPSADERGGAMARTA